MPTVQMVFRRSLRSVTSREAYLGGAAHPAAFAGTEINAARMVSLANAIAADAIPPQVRLAVLEEDLGQPGVDFFGDGLSEQLFDTPAAVARVWRVEGRPPLDPGLGRRDPRPERPRPRLRLAAAAGRPGEGPDRAARRRIDGAHHPRLARPLPGLRRRPDRRPRASTSGSSPRTACTTAPRRSSAGTARRARRGATPPTPPAARRGSSRSTTPTRAAPRPTPTRSSCRAPTGATNSPPTPPGASPAGPATGRAATPRPSPPTAPASSTATPPARPSRVEAVAYPLGRDAAGRLVVEELSTGAYLDYQAAPGP